MSTVNLALHKDLLSICCKIGIKQRLNFKDTKQTSQSRVVEVKEATYEEAL